MGSQFGGKGEMNKPLIYTIQDLFPVLVDEVGSIVGFPHSTTDPVPPYMEKWEGKYQVVNAIKLTAKVDLEFEERIPPGKSQKEIEDIRQSLMNKLREELIRVVTKGRGRKMSCPKNPNGGNHEIEQPVPWIPELREKWQKLSMEDKIKSQFCKWCGESIW